MTDQHHRLPGHLDDDPLFSRPTVTGPFGALIDPFHLKVDPELGKQIRLSAAAMGVEVSVYLRDIVYEHVTGKSYSEWFAEAVKSRREIFERQAAERRENGSVQEMYGLKRRSGS